MDTRTKIISLEQAAALRASAGPLVLAAGCFDVLQASHARFLRGLSQDGVTLVVAVYGDEVLCRMRGQSRPVLSAYARAQLVAALAGVDYVLLWPEERLDALIEQLRPERVEAVPEDGGSMIREVLKRYPRP